MDLQKQLIATGLNPTQAAGYLLLLQEGRLAPPEAARQLGVTRTNAYKLFDQLADMGLAARQEVHKKVVYEPANPMALSNIVAEQRNLATQREDAVKEVLTPLLEKFHQHSEQPDVQVVTGRQAVVNAYRQQIEQLQPIYFIRSRSDLPVMGFDAMHEIRIMPARHGVQRYGITPDLSTGVSSNQGDKRSNLERTWVRQEDYSAPVEWSVSGSSLLIILFGAEPHAVTITNPLIAEAFRQLWHLMKNCLQSMDYYSELPRRPRTSV